MTDGYSRADVVAALRQKAGTVSQMLDRGGFVLPHMSPMRPANEQMVFSESDIAALSVIWALRDCGLSVRRASEVLQWLVEKGRAELEDVPHFIERWRTHRFLLTRVDAKTWQFSIVIADAPLGAWGPAAIVVDLAALAADATERARASRAARVERRHVARAQRLTKVA